MRKTWKLIGVTGIYLIGLVIATFFDQSISDALYIKDELVSTFLQIIVYIIATYTIVWCILISIRYMELMKTLPKIFARLMYVLGGIATCYMTYSATKSFIFPILNIPVFLMFFQYLYKKDIHWMKRMVRPAHYGILIIVCSIFFVEGLKLVMGRVRPRNLIEHAQLYSPWYQINGSKFLNMVSNRDEIKSFPSGHSAWATLSLVYYLFLDASNMLPSRKHIWKVIIVVYFISVMVSRIVLKAHFLSDTLVGSGIALMFYALFSRQYKSHK